MPGDELIWRRAVVCGGALLYWGGVLVQGRRIRKRIGRSPNLKPRNARERVLWVGWMLVVLVWIVQPLILGRWAAPQPNPAWLHPLGLLGGIALTVTGYAATLWCYVAMGNTWRIGINRKEKTPLVTGGPFRWVRHPIYFLQSVMLLGAMLLLPTFASAAAGVLHWICARLKAGDEEAYLVTVHGDAYRDFAARTGRLFPKLW